MADEKRVFKCASCAHVFDQDGSSKRCPECGSKVLILESGPSLRGGGCGCGGNCGSCGGGCSCGHHH